MKLVFRDARAGEVAIDASPGLTLMQNAKDFDVPGIEADCGGSMVCGTCQVNVDEPWYSALPAPSAMEAELLEYTAHPAPNGRLSCQIVVGADLEGIRLEVPRAAVIY